MSVLTLIPILIFLVLLAFSALRLAESLSHFLILGFLLLVAAVIPSGYILSALGMINNRLSWGLVLIIIQLAVFAILNKYFVATFSNFKELYQYGKEHISYIFSKSTLTQKITFTVLLIGVLVTTILNLVVLFVTYPNEWDSMTGHLVKCAYYLQNGSMDRLQGTSWTIDFYPNSLPTLQIFGYHIFGEKGFKLIHYLSYWTFVFTTYKITRLLFKSERGAFFVGLIAALLPSALIQAVTTETDIIQSAYLGLVIYYLIRWARENTLISTLLLSLSVAIWMSHKVTFLLIGPAVFVLFIYLMLKYKALWRSLIPLGVIFVLFFSIYVLPNGYWSNIKEVGHFSLGSLSGPPEVMKWHGIEHYSTKEKLQNFEFNILRYASDFLQLDGIRSTDLGNRMNAIFRVMPDKLVNRLGLEREMYWVVYPFETLGNKYMAFYKERPYWGIISFMLVLPSIIWLFIGYIRKSVKTKGHTMALVFSVAALIHFLSLCFSAPYDPIKGRYFMNMAVWCLPLLSWFFVQKKGMFYLFVCSLIIVLSGVLTLTHRKLYPYVGPTAFYKLNRIEQLTITRPEFTDAYLNFEKMVPADAVVALATQQEHEDYIYPLWGKDFKRTLIPIHPFRSKVKPVPPQSQYIFISEGVIPVLPSDTILGMGDRSKDTPVPESKYYLRKR